MTLEEAIVHSGQRRLRPVLMTSMAAALGMLPLAYGVGSGADMLRPLAIAVIGALCICSSANPKWMCRSPAIRM